MTEDKDSFEIEEECPRCGSPDPNKHPTQVEDEIQICKHKWHEGKE